MIIIEDINSDRSHHFFKLERATSKVLELFGRTVIINQIEYYPSEEDRKSAEIKFTKMFEEKEIEVGYASGKVEEMEEFYKILKRKEIFWRIDIRRDNGTIEMLCDHGIGHPIWGSQPKVAGHEDYILVHSCDGCCQSFSSEKRGECSAESRSGDSPKSSDWSQKVKEFWKLVEEKKKELEVRKCSEKQ